MKKNKFLNIVDVGCKFGIHPSFLQYKTFSNFLMIDADPNEISYLKTRYKQSENLMFENFFVTKKSSPEEKHVLNLYNHPGGHSKYNPEKENPYWIIQRPDSGNVISSIEIPGITLDQLCENHAFKSDFLKVDVEGAESEVLEGATRQLSEYVIGIRIEVLFNSLYENIAPTFGEIDEILRRNDFFLLNLDFPGNAYAPFSRFRGQPPYGFLIGGDAVYVKNPKFLKDGYPVESLIKASLFALTNNATDLTIDLLEFSSSLQSYNDILSAFPEVKKELEKGVASYVFKNQDLPGNSLDDFSDTWKKIFNSEPIKYGDFYRRFPLS